MSATVEATTTPTKEQIANALDESYAYLKAQVARLSVPLAPVPDEGGWTIRQLLSHLVGSLQRVPVYAGFILADAPFVPVDAGGDYWIVEWETAPVRSFALALDSAYHGCKALLGNISDFDLGKTAVTPFGQMDLGRLLLVTVSTHPHHHHGAQLESFID